MCNKNRRIAVRFASVTLKCMLAGWGGILLYMLFRSWQTNTGAALNKSYLYPASMIIAGIGVILCLGLLRANEEPQINAALLHISALSTLYLTEGVLLILTLAMSSGSLQTLEHRTFKKYANWARKQNRLFDTRTPLEVVADLNAQQIEAYPAMLPVYFLDQNQRPQEPAALKFLPLGGISDATTVLCNETGEYAIYQSDEHGFNNPPGVFSQRPVDILLTGDSYTHGYCVQDGEDIAGQLREREQTVINLGMGANGPLVELAALKEFAEPVQPDIVLWMYYEGNDLLDIGLHAECTLLRRYLDSDFSQNLRNRQAEVDAELRYNAARKMQQNQWIKQQKAPLVLLKKFVKLWRLRNLVGLAPVPPSENTPFRHRQPVADSLRLLGQVLERAQEMTTAWGGRFYVVYLPSWERYIKNRDNTAFQRDQVLSLIRQLNAPLIDMHDVLHNHDDPLSLVPFRGRGHFTREGYRLIAETIAQALEDEKTRLGQD